MSQIETLRQSIKTQADAMGGDGWLDIPVSTVVRPAGVLTVPRGAFEMWAVARSHGGHHSVGWKAVSKSGMKQGADDPYHTDWMLGAGLDLKDMHQSGGNPHWKILSAAAYSAKGEVEKRLLGFSCSILLAGPTIKGRVHIPASSKIVPDFTDEDGLPPILIVKNAGPAWLEAAAAALDAGGAVIVEVGGGVAHLITVLRATNKGPVIRMENARKLYPDGSVLVVSPDEGRLTLVEDERIFRQLVEESRQTNAIVTAEPPAVRKPKKTAKPKPQEFKFYAYEASGGKTPADRYPYLYPGYSETSGDYRIVSSLHSNDGGTHSWADTGMLLVSIREAGSGRGDVLARYCTDYRKWERGEIRRASLFAFEMALPHVVEEWRRQAEERRVAARLATEREEAEIQSRLDALSDDELEAYARCLGDEEFTLVESYDDGLLDDIDLRELGRDYTKQFHDIDFSARRRGLGLDTDTMRPILELQVPNAYRPYTYPDQDEAAGLVL